MKDMKNRIHLTKKELKLLLLFLILESNDAEYITNGVSHNALIKKLKKIISNK